jgi:hypothetical protein
VIGRERPLGNQVTPPSPPHDTKEQTLSKIGTKTTRPRSCGANPRKSRSNKKKSLSKKNGKCVATPRKSRCNRAESRSNTQEVAKQNPENAEKKAEIAEQNPGNSGEKAENAEQPNEIAEQPKNRGAT